jgi:hypothetical protein
MAPALRCLNIAAVFGFICSVFALIRHKHRGLLARLPSIIYFAIALTALLINLALTLWLYPIWTVLR